MTFKAKPNAVENISRIVAISNSVHWTEDGEDSEEEEAEEELPSAVHAVVPYTPITFHLDTRGMHGLSPTRTTLHYLAKYISKTH